MMTVKVPGIYYVSVMFGVTKKAWYLHLRKNGVYIASVQKDYNAGYGDSLNLHAIGPVSELPAPGMVLGYQGYSDTDRSYSNKTANRFIVQKNRFDGCKTYPEKFFIIETCFRTFTDNFAKVIFQP